MILCYNRKQLSMALTLKKTEYMATSLASCNVVWLHKMLTRLFVLKMGPTIIHCDKQSCIKLFENLVLHDRSKHL